MEKLISIIGQTSSGKSSLAIDLARFFDGEIVLFENNKPSFSKLLESSSFIKDISSLVETTKVRIPFSEYIADVFSRNRLSSLTNISQEEA